MYFSTVLVIFYNINEFEYIFRYRYRNIHSRPTQSLLFVSEQLFYRYLLTIPVLCLQALH